MAEEKSTAAKSTAAAPVTGGVSADGVFDGTVRYEGTVLVDREIDGQVVSVMTDRPLKGDKIQANELDPATGELRRSTKRTDEGHATPPRG